MVMRQMTGSVSAAADRTGADRKAAPSPNSRELARLIGGDDSNLALSALEKISGNQRALAYVAKNAPAKELKERAIEMLSGMLATLTDVGAILAAAMCSKDVDAKAAAGARILNLDSELIFKKPRKELNEDDLGALAFISANHPDGMKRRLADCKLPNTSKAGGVEFTEEVVSFSADMLAEIIEETQA
ncbi:MAG: hypothetical protein NTY83_04145 [Candidatus Micrarchaeota archaeon]|nr:hypothetical protein [Candidatus Micrarchaeota archaeon]